MLNIVTTAIKTISKEKLWILRDVTCGIRASFQTLGLIGSLAYKKETNYIDHVLNLVLYINIKKNWRKMEGVEASAENGSHHNNPDNIYVELNNQPSELLQIVK